jgi:rubrerythrin
MKEIPKPVVSAIFSNLAKAAEKQDRLSESEILDKLSVEYWKPDSAAGGLDAIKTGVEKDLDEVYPGVKQRAVEVADSGAQRCVKWGEKVSAIQKSLINRYASKGDELFEDKNIYVCEACGFIALSEDFPELCPVCKAPKSRFAKVG